MAKQTKAGNGDSYRRIEVSPGVYQCGCRWTKEWHGDRLLQCAIHHQATNASVARFERERTPTPEPTTKEAP